MRKHLLSFAVAAAMLASGCGSSDGFVVTGNNVQTGGASVANNDSYTTFGNAQIVLSAQEGVLANDVIDGDTVASNTQPANGTVEVNADGSFTYTPNTGFRGATDSFRYTLTNGSSADVNINLPSVAWFVNNTGAAGADGSLLNPFPTVAEAQAISQPGDIIFLFAGNGTPYGPIVLKDNQRLVGEASGLVAAQTIVPPPGGRPIITNEAGVGVTLANGNVIEGVEVSETSEAGIFGQNIAGLTLRNVVVRNTGEEALWVDQLSGNFDFSDSEFRNSGIDNILLEACSGNGTMSGITCIGANDDNMDVEEFTGTLTVTDSSFSGSLDDCLDFAELSGTVTLNRLTLATPVENCLQALDAEGGTLSISDSILAAPGFQGVCSESFEGGGITLSVTDCIIELAGGEAIYFFAEASGDCDVTISGNDIIDAATEFEAAAIYCGFDDMAGRLMVLDNLVTVDENDDSDEGLYIETDDGATLNCLVDFNEFIGLAEEGIYVDNASSTLNIGITTNTLDDNGDHSELDNSDSGLVCLRFNNNDYSNDFDDFLVDNNSGTLNLEATSGNLPGPPDEEGTIGSVGANSCTDIPTR